MYFQITLNPLTTLMIFSTNKWKPQQPLHQRLPCNNGPHGKPWPQSNNEKFYLAGEATYYCWTGNTSKLTKKTYWIKSLSSHTSKTCSSIRVLNNHIELAEPETEGSVRKIQKGHFFTTKTLKRAPLIWPPPMFIAS